MILNNFPFNIDDDDRIIDAQFSSFSYHHIFRRFSAKSTFHSFLEMTSFFNDTLLMSHDVSFIDSLFVLGSKVHEAAFIRELNSVTLTSNFSHDCIGKSTTLYHLVLQLHIAK